MEKKSGGLTTIPQKRTIAEVTNNHRGMMVGRFLDNPDLGERAVLRRSETSMALLRISRRSDSRIADQNATSVPFCDLRLQIKRRFVSNRLSGKIDTTHIVTRFVVFTWRGDNWIVAFGALIVSMSMTGV